MCINVCLYMWACMCIHMIPADLSLCMGDLQDDICNHTYTKEGEILYYNPHFHKDQQDCGLDTHEYRCPRNTDASPFLGI